MNEVILIGRLARDPELSYTQSQTAKCTFTLAVDRPVRQGEEKQADFIRVIVWKRQAETCGRYLYKGSQCAVNGSIRTGSYKNRDGQTVYTTDVWANHVEFLGGGAQMKEAPTASKPQSYVQVQESFNDLPDTFQAADDDIPF